MEVERALASSIVSIDLRQIGLEVSKIEFIMKPIVYVLRIRIKWVNNFIWRERDFLIRLERKFGYSVFHASLMWEPLLMMKSLLFCVASFLMRMSNSHCLYKQKLNGMIMSTTNQGNPLHWQCLKMNIWATIAPTALVSFQQSVCACVSVWHWSDKPN